MNKARRGIYAAAISPFGPTGCLDVVKLVDYCRYLLSDGGCDGVAPTGTTGEGTSISTAQRLAIPAAFAAAAIEPDRVILGTGSPAADDAVALTRAATDEGYWNALVLPPYYYKSPSDDGLFAYYARLIERIGDDRLRLFLYHFPQMSATPLSPALVNRLRAEFGEVVAGLKDSSGDFEQTRGFAEATGGVASGFDIYPSSEAFLFDGLDIGCAGVISGSTNAFAPLVQQAIRAAGPEREEAFRTVRAARAIASKYPLVGAMKAIRARRSGDEEWRRLAPPLVPLPPAQEASLFADLETLPDATLPAVAAE